MNDDFIKKNIIKELTSQGFNLSLASTCAGIGVKYYRETAKFQGSAYAECCNHAGLIATQRSVGIKFKPVKPKRQARSKRPPEAWGF